MNLNISKKISFSANITYDENWMKTALNADKRLTKKDKKSINLMLADIKKLESMKEDSFVMIHPRVDTGQVNFICIVSDFTNKIKTIIPQRNVRKMLVDDNYKDAFKNSIKTSIVNVDKAKEAFDKISDAIISSKSIKGLQSTFIASTEPLNRETIYEYFNSGLENHFLDMLNKGYNPADRVIKIIKQVDEDSPETNKIIGIVPHKTKSGKLSSKKDFVVFYDTGKNIVEKRIPINYLLQDPSMNVFA